MGEYLNPRIESEEFEGDSELLDPEGLYWRELLGRVPEEIERSHIDELIDGDDEKLEELLGRIKAAREVTTIEPIDTARNAGIALRTAQAVYPREFGWNNWSAADFLHKLVKQRTFASDFSALLFDKEGDFLGYEMAHCRKTPEGDIA